MSVENTALDFLTHDAEKYCSGKSIYVPCFIVICGGTAEYYQGSQMCHSQGRHSVKHGTKKISQLCENLNGRAKHVTVRQKMAGI